MTTHAMLSKLLDLVAELINDPVLADALKNHKPGLQLRLDEASDEARAVLEAGS